MAQGIYKINEIINLTYQAVGCLSNALPTCKVFDEAGASDLVAQSDLHSALSAGEKTDGRYHGHFTPDAEGRWTVCIKDKNSDGEVTKTYNVCGFNIDALGDAQVALESGLKSDALLVKSDLVSSIKEDCDASASDIKSAVLVGSGYATSGATSGAVATISGAIAALDTSDVKSAVLAQASDVKSAVKAIASPAMVS